MKYLSLLLVLVVMRWTWSLSYSDRAMSLENHREMEVEVQKIIDTYIHEHQPDAQDIRFSQLYTEIIKPAEHMRVHFRYTFDSPSSDGMLTQQNFQGDMTLASTDGINWKKTDGHLHERLVRFLRPTRVMPGDQPTEVLTEEPSDIQ